MLTTKEKEVLRSLVQYHLKEVKDDKMVEDVVAVLGAEALYEKTLKDILKKLK
jgi:hypothetical protein